MTLPLDHTLSLRNMPEGKARDQGRGSGNERRWNYLEKGKMQDLTIDWLGRRLPL